MVSEKAHVDQLRRQLGGINAALNRARQHERDLFVLVSELYASLPEEEKQKFKERFDAEVAKAKRK